MNKILIITGTKPARLVRYAAEQLAHYLTKLFDLSARVAAAPGKSTADIITLDAGAPPIPDQLSDQGYVLRPVDVDGRKFFQVAGGSPTATMWAVYDLVERWGVRYELHGDLFPDRPGRMQLPRQAVVCDPDLRWRAYRTYNDFPNNECTWPAVDYQVLIDQLAKMRMNGIIVICRPHDPFYELEFRGTHKTTAVTNFGYRPTIRPDHPGYELFEASGDAARGVFVNPELSGHQNSKKAIAAGRRYVRKVFRMAHARGMSCCLKINYTDFDPAIKQRLLEVTEQKHKAPRGEVTRLRYGDWLEGPSVEVGRCMSIRNPVFFELMTAAVQAQIDCMPDADLYSLGVTEFRESAADSEQTWKRLDRKYGLSKIAQFDQLIDEARAMSEDSADRSEHMLRADIVSLYVLDILINERDLDLSKARKGARIIADGLSPELHRFLPSIFPPGTLYIAEMGYMPSHVAKRSDTLLLDDPKHMRMSLVISLEDDNVGLAPQLTGPAVRKLVETLRASGAEGFHTRQWMHSNLQPTLHYLAHAAWEQGWTPAKAYRHFFEGLCGSSAMGPVAKAFRALENLTEDLHTNVFCISFPLPNLLTEMWDCWPEQYTPERLAGIARAYQRISDGLAQAVRASKPAGRDYLYSLERHCRHAEHYVRGLIELGAAREANRQAAAASTGNSFDELDKWSAAAATHLRQSTCEMRRACEAFAEGVRDRCDLGALATLNNYRLDPVNAYAVIAETKASALHVMEH
jgi:hypothetical protein